VKSWENYIAELYDRPNGPETLQVESTQTKKALVFCKRKWEKLQKMIHLEMHSNCGEKIVSNYLHGWSTTYMKLAVVQGLHWLYDYCPNEEAKSYKMQWQSHSQHHRTYSQY